MSKQAMTMALDALQSCTYDEEGYCLIPDNEDAIAALRSALDAPERELLSDERIIDIAINLKRPSPHECTPVFLTGSNLGYRRFRSAGDHAHVNADDLLLFVRAIEQEVRGK